MLTIFPLENCVNIWSDTSKHAYVSRIIQLYVIYILIKPENFNNLILLPRFGNELILQYVIPNYKINALLNKRLVCS